jgi:glycosyltransferase involved in cell wall biosynthesis
MLRVLTLSTLFPDAGRPSFGVFVERQTLGLAALGDVAVEVVCGRGVPPFPLSLHPHYRRIRTLPPRESWKGVTVHRPRFRAIPRLGDARAAEELAKAVLPLARKIRPDVIDAEFFWPDGVAAMHVAKALGIPFSIKARGSDIDYWGGRPGIRPQMIDAARQAGGLLAVSEALKQRMAALGMPGERTAVHYTGVDLDRFRPLDRSAAKASLGISGPLIAAVGALIPLKGQRLALQALALLPGATLMLIGDGPDAPALKGEALRLGVADRTRFLGSQLHDALPALVGAADVMLLPSEREGLANAWVEALACGTPIVISDVGGAREVIDRPEAGRIVPRQPEAIGRAVRELLENPPQPPEVRAAAERFSWDRNARELRGHLMRISAERH